MEILKSVFGNGVGRKFVACMSVQAAHIALMAMGKIPADNYEFLTMILMGGYIGGNIGSTIVKKKGIKIDNQGGKTIAGEVRKPTETDK